jgi:uncharacterized protein (TIGR03437 family)
MRTQSLRNVALRGPYMHTGGIATLAKVVEFYNRGGDFTSPNKDIGFVRRLNLSDQEKSDLAAFLERSLTDPRVSAAQGPLFDHPMLYTESARVPVVDPGAAGVEVTVIEPPELGNPSFTVAVSNAPGGGEATLVIGGADPGAGSAIPSSGSLFRGVVATEGDGPRRRASVSVPLPSDPALAGQTFFGRWYLPREDGGVTVSPVFHMTLFAPADTSAAGPQVSALSTVSAASFAPGLVSPESLVSGFGSGLAASSAAATATPLPTTLAGVTVAVRDSAGVERLAPLHYVSANQINYLVPPETAPGEAAVFVRSSGAVVAAGALQVAPVAPVLFAANANGTGPAAAQVVRVAADNSQSIEPAVEPNEAAGALAARPIVVDSPGEQVILILYGAGVRFATGEVTASVAGEPAAVLFAGRQSQFPGVDQINVRLSPALKGRGEVEVVVHADGRSSNPVRIHIR